MYYAFFGTLRPVVRGGQLVAWLHRPDNKAALARLNRMDRADRSRERMAADLKSKVTVK